MNTGVRLWAVICLLTALLTALPTALPTALRTAMLTDLFTALLYALITALLTVLRVLTDSTSNIGITASGDLPAAPLPFVATR
jgi:hypothetical protein